MLVIDVMNVGDVYFKLAKYMLSVKLALVFSSAAKTISSFSLCNILNHMYCSAYPSRDSTNISKNKGSVIFGLAFLQEK